MNTIAASYYRSDKATNSFLNMLAHLTMALALVFALAIASTEKYSNANLADSTIMASRIQCAKTYTFFGRKIKYRRTFEGSCPRGWYPS